MDLVTREFPLHQVINNRNQGLYRRGNRRRFEPTEITKCPAQGLQLLLRLEQVLIKIPDDFLDNSGIKQNISVDSVFSRDVGEPPHCLCKYLWVFMFQELK